MRTLIVIPAYNEEANIVSVIEGLSLIKNLADYVIVNDGSIDHTADICMANGYSMINLPVNIGLAGAFQAGIMYALRNQYDSVMQFDADGQHNACYIEQMISKLEFTGCDIVIGSRFVRGKKPRSLRMAGNRIIQFAVRLTARKQLTDPTSGMRIYNQRIMRILASSTDLGPEPDTLAYLARAGASIDEIQVTMNERTSGKSYLTITRSIKYMLHMCLSIFFIQWFRSRLKIS